jgi:hypothetical protein
LEKKKTCRVQCEVTPKNQNMHLQMLQLLGACQSCNTSCQSCYTVAKSRNFSRLFATFRKI